MARAGARLAVTLLIVVLGSGLLAPGPALGFAEDFCMVIGEGSRRRGELSNCYDLHCMDGVRHGSFGAFLCSAKQMAVGAANTFHLRSVRGRSMVHFDATYAIAQVLGMSPTAAYWLAAYDEAVDPGVYEAYDRAGRALAAYTTAPLLDVVRTDFDNGGVLFHFVPPAETATIGDSFDLEAPAEAPLRHIRDWAFGRRKTLCRGLLASTPFTDAPGCYEVPGGGPIVDFKFPIRESEDSFGIGGKVAAGEVRVADPEVVADLGGLIEIAVYLHSLADRVSHHACCDVSPCRLGKEGRYEIRFGPPCTQPNHAAFHAQEVAHEELPPRTRIALEHTYEALDAWLAEFPRWRTEPSREVERDALVAALVDALEPREAAGRLDAFHRLWEEHGLCGLPGDESAARACFPDAR